MDYVMIAAYSEYVDAFGKDSLKAREKYLLAYERVILGKTKKETCAYYDISKGSLDNAINKINSVIMRNLYIMNKGGYEEVIRLSGESRFYNEYFEKARTLEEEALQLYRKGITFKEISKSLCIKACEACSIVETCLDKKGEKITYAKGDLCGLKEETAKRLIINGFETSDDLRTMTKNQLYFKLGLDNEQIDDVLRKANQFRCV